MELYQPTSWLQLPFALKQFGVHHRFSRRKANTLDCGLQPGRNSGRNTAHASGMIRERGSTNLKLFDPKSPEQKFQMAYFHFQILSAQCPFTRASFQVSNFHFRIASCSAQFFGQSCGMRLWPLNKGLHGIAQANQGGRMELGHSRFVDF